METQKAFFEADDIMERYGVGRSQAYDILRGIKSLFPQGGALGAGKVLRGELEAWETYRAELIRDKYREAERHL